MRIVRRVYRLGETAVGRKVRDGAPVKVVLGRGHLHVMRVMAEQGPIPHCYFAMELGEHMMGPNVTALQYLGMARSVGQRPYPGKKAKQTFWELTAYGHRQLEAFETEGTSAAR